ncbi:MEKHLA domain-containing protein [Methylococcus geothermalis]|uniref:MEKHLA domain-containing protein n=1 Tax=Methylococcus geothermalis TaxID=2681310 RepID=A0A858QBI2_9GAMM|nr:MEKHLA domain-containing protein [Methylococcus geothermalis]QJD31141.1 MEKHLA domain-containing protein [Methylococcus geothermalis]
MAAPARPSEDNGFLAPHIAVLRRSFRHFTGRELVPARMTDPEAGRYLFRAPLALLSHDTSPDPIFNYANETAMELFGMSWEEITALPSRLSAEPVDREARDALLAKVAAQGHIDDYSGIRISRQGRKFRIENAVVWNLFDELGSPCGQAAMFEHWQWL